jgi:hypothetical protein
MVKQTNKQTTKVIVKIGTDVIKRKRTRRNKKVQPPQPPQNRPPQVSFGTLSSQNSSLNAFSSNIQSQLDNLLKSQSNLNTIVNKLRSEQRPEQNEGQNAQIVSALNLNSEEPIDYEALEAEKENVIKSKLKEGIQRIKNERERLSTPSKAEREINKELQRTPPQLEREIELLRRNTLDVLQLPPAIRSDDEQYPSSSGEEEKFPFRNEAGHPMSVSERYFKKKKYMRGGFI